VIERPPTAVRMFVERLAAASRSIKGSVSDQEVRT
jgi:hypothetical protein